VQVHSNGNQVTCIAQVSSVKSHLKYSFLSGKSSRGGKIFSMELKTYFMLLQQFLSISLSYVKKHMGKRVEQAQIKICGFIRSSRKIVIYQFAYDQLIFFLSDQT
jgi:hypothetical protein